jgi:DNA-binding transcriptional LysR family regulator
MPRTAPRDAMPDLGTRHLRALVALAQYGNFAAAASALAISQPTLTRTIRRTEDALGIALFSRTTRRVSLTPAGREFVPLAERLLGDLGLGVANIRELAGIERGRIVVATLMSVAHGAVPHALEDFTARHPSVVIVLREGVQASVLEEVRSGAADFGLGDVSNAEGPFATEPLGVQEFHVVLPAGHRLLARKSLTLADLGGEALISLPMEAAARRILDGAALAGGVALTPRITVGQFTTVFQLVAQGLGVSVVPSMLFAGAVPPGVATRPLRAPRIVQHVGFVARRDRALTPAAAAFQDALRRTWPKG